MGREVRLAPPAVGHVRVALGRREIGVPEHLLHGAEIGAPLEQMRRERVAEQVRMDAFGLEPGLLRELAQDQEGSRPGQGAATRVQEQVGPVAPVEMRAAEREVPADRLGCRSAEGDDALLVALAEDADDAGVDVDRRACQADRLGDAQPRAVHELHEGAIAHRPRRRPVGSLDQALGLGRRERARQLADAPWRRDLRRRVVLAEAQQQLVAEGRAHGGDPSRDRRGREPHRAHGRDPRLEHLRRCRRDRAVEEDRQGREITTVGVDRAGGALRGEQEQVALYLGVGRRRGGGRHAAGPDSARRALLLRGGGGLSRAGVARVVDPPQPAGVDVAVDLRRRERGVPEQLLDRAEIGSAFEEMRRVRVPQPVGVAHQPAQHRRVERTTAVREEQRVVRAPGERGPCVTEIQAQGVRRPLAEGHDALLAALAEDVHRLLVEVDVGEAEPHRLGAPQAARVRQLEDRRVPDRERPVSRDRGEQFLDVRELRRVGQPAPLARGERDLGHARCAEGEPDERPHCGEPPGDRRRREPTAAATELGGVLRERLDVDVVEHLGPCGRASRRSRRDRTRTPAG